MKRKYIRKIAVWMLSISIMMVSTLVNPVTTYSVDIGNDVTNVHNVIYDGNGNDGGIVPTDTANYSENDSVKVEEAVYLTKNGYVCVGWNTKPDGTGTLYKPGTTFSMGKENVTLYAQWCEGVRYEAENATLYGATRENNVEGASGKSQVGSINNYGYYAMFTNIPAYSKVTIRYASMISGTISVYLNNDKIKNLSFSSTGNWGGEGNYKYVTFDVNIPSNAILRFEFDNGDAAINLDYIECYSPVPFQRYEAENATINGSNIETNKTNASGGGQVGNINQPDRNVEFTNLVSGNKVLFRYATTQTGTISIYKNNVHYQDLSFDSTGDWYGYDKYRIASMDIDINKGDSLKIQYDNGDAAINIDYIEVERQFTVDFNSNGGTNVASQKITPNSKTTIPIVPQKLGCTFENWYSDPQLTQVFDFNTLITEDKTLYAKWIINPKITLKTENIDGGTVNVTNTETVGENVYSAKSGTEIVLNAIPKLGYKFDGWYDANNNKVNSSSSWTFNLTDDVAYTAKFIPIPAAKDVRIDGIAKVGQQLTAYYTYEDADGDLEGASTFKWYRSDDDKGTGKSEIQGATDTTYTLTEDDEGKYISFEVLPKAQTGELEGEKAESGYTERVGYHVVTFNVDGGSIVESQSIKENEKAVKPTPDPTKQGYTFNSWYTDNTFTKEFDFETPITVATTVYAKWDINSYPVSFDVNDGSSVESQNITYNEKATKPQDPIRSGFTFAGWYTDRTFTKEFDFTIPITGATTIYANWKCMYFQLGSYKNQPILWRVLDVNDNGILLITDKIITQKAFDAAHSGTQGEGSTNVDQLGSSRWKDSCIRTWLNSDDTVVSYTYAPKAEAVYKNPYDTEKGFLTNFSETEKNVINTISNETEYTTSNKDITNDNVFLLSLDDLENTNYFANSNARIAKTTSNDKVDYWTRSALDTTNPYGCDTSGYIMNQAAFDGRVGVRPALYLKSEIFAPGNLKSCGDGTETNPYYLDVNTVTPKVTTNPVAGISLTYATVSGNVYSRGGADVTSNGFVYGTSENPTIGNTVGGGQKEAAITGDGTGEISQVKIDNLKQNTTYYVRAYATNSYGTSYGEEVKFTTQVNYTISGKITTGKGVGIPGIKINCVRDAGGAIETLTAITDANGNYSFTVRGGWNVEVTPQYPGGNCAFYPSKIDYTDVNENKIEDYIYNTPPTVTYITIEGTPEVGQTLKVDYNYEDADDDLEGSSLIQWYRYDVENDTWMEIEGATEKTYTLTGYDADTYIYCKITPIAETGYLKGRSASWGIEQRVVDPKCITANEYIVIDNFAYDIRSLFDNTSAGKEQQAEISAKLNNGSKIYYKLKGRLLKYVKGGSVGEELSDDDITYLKALRLNYHGSDNNYISKWDFMPHYD